MEQDDIAFMKASPGERIRLTNYNKKDDEYIRELKRQAEHAKDELDNMPKVRVSLPKGINGNEEYMSYDMD